MPDPAPFGVNPVEAVDFLRRKTRVPTQRWTDVWQDMHSVGFMVAGAQSDALLADFHEAVNRNIAEGRTLEQFRADFDRIVADHGWSYRGSRNWRSRVIFQTNLRTAYAAGRWAQIQRLKARRPFLRYVAVMDERTRPLHRHWHDTVLPVDDPWWQTHFPPNGWNCRCSVQQLSARDVKRYGLKVSTTSPEVTMVEREINTMSGKVTLRVPEGIDPGFAYNPGSGAFGRGAQLLAMERHGSWEPLQAPGSPAPQTELPVDTPAAALGPAAPPGKPEALIRLLERALGGTERVVVDPTGVRVRLTAAIADHLAASASRQDGRERYFPMLPEVIENPAEIWIGWAINTATGRVALRRRYVKLIDIGKEHVLGFVADADNGEWSGVTFFRGIKTGARRLRIGRLIYERG